MTDVQGPEGARMECPHCRREVPVGDECPLCGIVYARYQARHEQPGPAETESVVFAPAEHRAPLTRTVLLAALALAVAAFAWDRHRDESATAEALRTAVDPAQARGPSTPAHAPETTPRVATRSPAPEPPPPPSFEAPPVAPPSPPPTSPEPTDLPAARSATYTYDWYEGADGFARGWREALEENRAIAVYFYTDWCGYCRQLERELLERANVENYIKYLTKVKINPENGPTERAIANRYRVTGYPSFFVHAAVDRGPTKVNGMKRRHGEWRVKSPDEFVETIRRVVGD